MSETRNRDPSSATLSLLDLRRELIRRAVICAHRARRCRERGDLAGARRLSQEATRLRAAAQAVQVERS